MTQHFLSESPWATLSQQTGCQPGGAEVVRWPLGPRAGRRVAPDEPPAGAVRSHAHGAVLLSLHSADPDRGVQRGSQAEARAGRTRAWGYANIPW